MLGPYASVHQPSKAPCLTHKKHIPASRLPEADRNSATAVHKVGSHSSSSDPTWIICDLCPQCFRTLGRVRLRGRLEGGRPEGQGEHRRDVGLARVYRFKKN